VIGPWEEQIRDAHKMHLAGLKLVESDRKVEVYRTGVYFIYSQVGCATTDYPCFKSFLTYSNQQVTYASENDSNSYSINVISAEDKINTPISVCNAPGKVLAYSDISCYTSSLRSLKSGDIIYLQQIEQNRNIDMQSSSTYFGVILLSG